MDFLTVITPEGTTFRHELEGPALRIGRSSDSSLVLQDPSVSRLHAEIVRRHGRCVLTDFRSKAGTLVNDHPVQDPVHLQPGDRIRMGGTLLIFNDTPSGSVSFSDRPLGPHSRTTFVSARGVRLPAEERITPVPKGRIAEDGDLGSPPSLPGASIGHIASEIDQELLFHRPLGEILEKVMDLAHEAVSYERGALMLVEKNGDLTVGVRRSLTGVAENLEVSRTVIDHVRKNEESVLTQDALVDERFRNVDSVHDLGIHSVMCVPLLGSSDLIGVIYVDSRREVGLFDERDLRLLTFLGNLAAVKIENARLFQETVAQRVILAQLREAAEVQRRLLPDVVPRIQGYSIHGSTDPCFEVGGDYYDYLALPDGRYGIALADVAGKGLSAALLVSNFQASLRVFSGFHLSLEETIGRLNLQLCRSMPESRFIALFYGILDPTAHTLRFVNAGLPPPVLIRRNGAVERLTMGALPLGMFTELALQVGTVGFEPGEILVCYSDGVTEARNLSDEMFGEERLVALLRGARDLSSSKVVGGIMEAVEGHCATSRHQDDVTVVALRRAA